MSYKDIYIVDTLYISRNRYRVDIVVLKSYTTPHLLALKAFLLFSKYTGVLTNNMHINKLGFSSFSSCT